jgi:hypothetical protein
MAYAGKEWETFSATGLREQGAFFMKKGIAAVLAALWLVRDESVAEK